MSSTLHRSTPARGDGRSGRALTASLAGVLTAVLAFTVAPPALATDLGSDPGATETVAPEPTTPDAPSTPVTPPAPTPTPTSTPAPPQPVAPAVTPTPTPTPTAPPATTTVKGWDGSRTVRIGFAAGRRFTVTPALGRTLHVQRFDGKTWTTIQTLTAGTGTTAELVARPPAAKTGATIRYRLAIPATSTGKALTSAEWVVTYRKHATSVSGWPRATTHVPYGRTASRTVTIQAGRSVQLQRLVGSTWTTLSTSTVPSSGQLAVTTPVITSASTYAYRLRIAPTDTHEVRMSAAWTIVPSGPVMPPQRYNGEVRNVVGTWGGFSNGHIPTSTLCTPAWAASHHKVRCDANAALTELNAAYRNRFGTNLVVTSTYRTYAQQVALKKQKPTLAATPGTSNHGWGLAADLGGGVQVWGSPQHNWMRANANKYGWFHPAWAQYDGSLPEPWHWEYAGAVASGRADQSKALAMQLVRTQPWNSETQRGCLSTLWQATSGWSYTKAVGQRRGIPQTDMVRAFGPSWTSSATATAFRQNPKTQIEWGLRDITQRRGNACAALSTYRAKGTY
ncbi:M15 family metallopeptidase [Actinotalea sp. BY-33]|uniref:M15 family metallopeptidase n=1 Tax=Actinotalea soli TaxID=2819234 RepID=A0A939LQX7_9CELL|nr:M15 family metallopeptidase [Actinotalea soli]MBO1752821.1 M15 family metallopeptidase [Actinotalea soli]